MYAPPQDAEVQVAIGPFGEDREDGGATTGGCGQRLRKLQRLQIPG